MKLHIGNARAAVLVAILGLAMGGTANASVILSELDLSANRVELVNTGGTTVDLSSYWWCNRVNGSPRYAVVGSSSTIDATLSTATSFTVAPGEILVLTLTDNFLPDINGELGLYSTSSFSSASSIEDYVLWGASGARDSVAELAGIWTDNDFIDISGLAAGDSIQLGLGLAGNAVSDYIFAPETFGSAQSVPEPGTALLLLTGLVHLSMRARLHDRA